MPNLHSSHVNKIVGLLMFTAATLAAPSPSTSAETPQNTPNNTDTGLSSGARGTIIWLASLGAFALGGALYCGYKMHTHGRANVRFSNHSEDAEPGDFLIPEPPR
jgi:hypothetical protein